MKAANEFRIIILDDNPSLYADFVKTLTPDSLPGLTELSVANDNKKITDLAHLPPKFLIDIATQRPEGTALIKQAFAEKRPYSLVFVDILMPPHGDGAEKIHHILEIDKDIQIVICMDNANPSWPEAITHFGQAENIFMLKKPFDTSAAHQLTIALMKLWKANCEARKLTAHLQQQIENQTLLLQQSQSLVKATLESTNDGILVIDKKGFIIDCNKQLLKLWGLPNSLLNHKNKINFFEAVKDKLLKPQLITKNMYLLQIDPDTICLDVIKLRDGRTLEYYSQPQKYNDKTLGRTFDFRDVTKRAQLEEKLLHQSTHDALTGLANKAMLTDRLRHELKAAKQNRTMITAIFLDLDRFKFVNDSFTHAVGDKLLQAIAQRLQSCVRVNDLLARLGGDEFVIIMTNTNTEQEIANSAQRILRELEKPFNIAGQEIIMTASLGVSVFPKDGDTVDILLRNADAAMYCAKKQKGNCFEFYSTEMNAQCVEKFNREIEMRRALDNKEFYLCYQPQFNIVNEQLVAVEALIRWQHPTAGELQPRDFMSLAEETGLIVPIGEWVMRTACMQCKKWQDMGYPHIRVAVNVHRLKFEKNNLVHDVSQILQETGLEPKYLELELSENIIINNAHIISTINELKKLGVTIAVDDFGTGYSCLGYLKDAALDRLKIDNSYIQHVRDKSDDEAIVRAIIAMAKNLNLEVLAEGVETQNQFDFLKKNDCGEVQGFYFSKPLKSEELENLLVNFKNIDLSKLLVS